MKKINFLIAMICLLSFAPMNAQLEKGNIMVGVSSTLSLSGTGSDFMSIGYTTTKYKSGNYTSDPYKTICFNLIPKAGYFIMDNIAAGLNIIISTSSETDTGDDDKYVDNLFGAGPWVRYYYPLEKIYPFAEVNVGIGSSKYEYGSTSEEKYSTFIFGGGAGVAIPLSDMVTFDIMAGYTSMTTKPKGTDSGDYKEIMGTIGATFGFVVYLGR